MNKPAPPGTASPPPRPRAECCSEPRCESGLRNNYFEGKRLTADSFRVEQRYQVDRRRLLNSAIHGWGVVYGYGVGLEPPNDCGPGGAPGRAPGRLAIGSGLALDECGRELLQVRPLTLAFDAAILLDEAGARTGVERVIGPTSQPPVGGVPARRCWLLRVHFAEQPSGPVPVDDPCGCERREHDHTCETVRYSLQVVDCEACCHALPCELQCGCGRGRCCEPVSVPAADDPHHDQRVHVVGQAGGLPFQRGGCRCLCDHLTSLPLPECGGLCEIDEPCGPVRVDLRHGVPLACVELVEDCGRWTFGGEVEACGPRRLVKRNDLLFDFIRGCDLTRISEIGWWPWHRAVAKVPFEDFAKALGELAAPKHEYVARDFWVTFSQLVPAETLRPDCFAMTVLSVESEGGWLQPFHIPIVGVQYIRQDSDPLGLVRGAKLCFDGAWFEDAVHGRRTLFMGGETYVEIEVRGDFILDCNGQPVDANAVGLLPFPSGSSTPGGTFLSTFCVEEAPPRDGGYESGYRRKGASS